MIALDMDGVLADFDAGLRAHGVDPNWDILHLSREEMTPAQIAADDRIRESMATPGFFEWLAPMWDARELWRFCERVDPDFVVLTARPRRVDTAARVAREKRAFIHRVFGPIQDSRFICCLASEKCNYVGQCGSGTPQILVDDRLLNCTDWCRAGGYAVLHTSAEDSIRRIQTIMDEVGHLAMA